MDMTKALGNISKNLKANFILNNRPITYAEVFADTGLLPALARRADQLCLLCLGYGIGVSFEEVESSFLGVKAVFDEVTPHVLRYACFTDVICSLMQGAPTPDQTPLDELMYD